MPTKSIRRLCSSCEALEARIAPAILFGINRVAANSSQELVSFDSSKPGTLLFETAITGIGAGESVIGIDFRPADGQLYAVTIDATHQGRLYTIALGNASATPVGAVFGLALDNAAQFDIDFNPQVDRLRVVSSDGQNFRVDPATGAVIDGDANTSGTQPDAPLTYKAGDPNAGATPHIGGIAYTNSFPGATSTALFDLDSALGVSTLQDPPNAGTLTTGFSLKVKPTAVNGFDLLPGTSTGFAALEVGGVNKLYTVDLATGATRLAGTIGNPTMDILGLAALPSGLGINGKTATYRDVDGDTVTLKTSAGTFRREYFTFSAPNGVGGVQLRKLDISTADTFAGAALSITAKSAALGGNNHVDVGRIDATEMNLGSLTVKGDLASLTVGTTAADDGPALTSLSVASVSKLGLLTQGGAGAVGLFLTGDVKSISVAGSIIQGSGIAVNGDLKTLSVGGVLGGVVSAHGITTSAKVGSFINGELDVSGDVKALATGDFLGLLNVGGVLGSLAVAGDLGFSGITVTGHANPATSAAALAVGSIMVKGQVYGSQILVGYNSMAVGVNQDVQVGKVTVGGSWSGSDLIVGVKESSPGTLGSSTDVSISGGNPALLSRIASITIKGEVLGSTTGGPIAFEANQIGAASFGGAKVPLTAALDKFVFGGGNGAVLREIA